MSWNSANGKALIFIYPSEILLPRLDNCSSTEHKQHSRCTVLYELSSLKRSYCASFLMKISNPVISETKTKWNCRLLRKLANFHAHGRLKTVCRNWSSYWPATPPDTSLTRTKEIALIGSRLSEASDHLRNQVGSREGILKTLLFLRRTSIQIQRHILHSGLPVRSEV